MAATLVKLTIFIYAQTLSGYSWDTRGLYSTSALHKNEVMIAGRSGRLSLFRNIVSVHNVNTELALTSTPQRIIDELPNKVCGELRRSASCSVWVLLNNWRSFSTHHILYWEAR